MGRVPKYRMYIDEVGNSDLGASHNPNHRYLSLTGCIVSLDYAATTLSPQIEDLKRRYFGAHPDEPIILHRKELVNQRPPFVNLRDPAIRQAFDTELMGLITGLEFVVITAVIDKLDHLNRYHQWSYDPYNYCLTILLERFTLWLEERRFQGDVMAESRGRKEDLRLKGEYERIYRSGTDNITHARFVGALTSSQLKVKPKSANVAGLQLADLVAHPSFVATKVRHEGGALPANFGGEVAQVLEASKYRRSWSGRVDGWGRKWLP
jgi:Protein of unknown function (DUF3800)